MKENEIGIEYYTSEEILQILIDLYNFQAYFCLEIERGHHLSVQTTIREWRKICDLKEPIRHTEDIRTFFNIEDNPTELISLLSVEENTLGMLCNYVAEEVTRDRISTVVSLETRCPEAAIFKKLKKEFEKRGINTTDFKPSTAFVPFFYKHAKDIVEIVSKLSPGTLSYYRFEYTLFYKLGTWLSIGSLVILVIMMLLHFLIWYVILLLIGIVLLFAINNVLEIRKSDISGYHTIKDLVAGMKKQMDSN